MTASSAIESPLRTNADRPSIRHRIPAATVAIAAVDLVVVTIFSLISPDHVFFDTATITTIALGAAQIVLLGIGTAFLLGAGEFDLSLGANVMLSSVVGAKVMLAVGDGTPSAGGATIVFGVLTCVACGALFGLVNGIIVTRFRVNALIGTLGMLGVGTGVGYVLTGGSDLLAPVWLQESFGIRNVLGVVPLPAVVTAVCVVVAFLALTKTRFGLLTIAAGSSRDAAIRSGLAVRKHILVLFVLAGTLAGIAAVMDLSRYTTTNIAGHQTDALSAVAGAVIGGTALFGGRVSIGGTVLGCLLPVILAVGLVLQGLQPFYQQIAVGVVLVVAVAIRSRDTSGTGFLARSRNS
jgi:ribose transport system permease protein